PTTKGKPRRFARQAALRFALHHRTPLLYKPLGHRAEAPPHGQVTPTLPEESWGQVYTFFFLPKGRVGAECTVFFFPEGESWGQMYTFLFPEGFPEGEPDGTRRSRLAPTRRAYLATSPPRWVDPRGSQRLWEPRCSAAGCAQIRLAPSDPPSNFPPTHLRIPLFCCPEGEHPPSI